MNMDASHRVGRLLVLLLGTLLPRSAAHAFVDVALSGDLVTAPRWSSSDTFGRGLGDGTLAVRITTNFAADVSTAVTGSAPPENVAAIESAVVAAFRAWESPVLHFTVTFDAPTVRDPATGGEIDVFQVLSSDPDFATSGANFGVTYLNWAYSPNRLLTNGTTSSGLEIYGADILIATDRLAAFAPAFTPDQQLKLFQRLLTHEIGHAIGLHHPHSGPTINYDSDADPDNAILIDPSNPLAGLSLSPNLDTLAVMYQVPSDVNALFYTSLRNDDRGGRDVLYPAIGDTQGICQPVPAATCGTALKSTAKVRHDAVNDAKDLVQWKWSNGSATTATDFGPPSGAPRYSLCLYSGTIPALMGELALPPGSAWISLGTKGFKYKEPTAIPHGVRTANLKAGLAGKAKTSVKAVGVNVPPLLPLGADPVVFQLVRADTMACWGSTFAATDITVNDGAGFLAKHRE